MDRTGRVVHEFRYQNPREPEKPRVVDGPDSVGIAFGGYQGEKPGAGGPGPRSPEGILSKVISGLSLVRDAFRLWRERDR